MKNLIKKTIIFFIIMIMILPISLPIVSKAIDSGKILTSQEDYLVEPESVAQYIGKKDIDGTPLFLGDTVSFYFMKECHFGQIQFDTRILSYIVNLPSKRQ